MGTTSKVVSTTHVSWFFVGFDFVLLPLLAREIGASYFPNINPEVSILAVYGTFSLSLLARFFGGIILGTAADSYGRKSIVIMSLFVMSTLTLFSAFLPGVHDVTVDWALPVMISFITLRIVIGFFIGGIWPTAAVSAMEELDEVDKQKIYSQRKVQEIFEEATKKRTRASAIMQSGYHSGHLIATFIALGLLVYSNSMPVPLWQYSHLMPFKDAFPWRTLCFIGGVFGIAWTIYLMYSEKKRKEEKEKEQEMPSKSDIKATRPIKIIVESSLKALLSKGEYQEYRDILFNFWLIMTGLLYMYYSAIIILPQMLVRNDLLIPYQLSSNEAYPLVIILILVSTLGAHLWLGFFCHSAWKWSELYSRASGWSWRKSGRFGFLVYLLMELRKIWFSLINKITNSIGMQGNEKQATELDDIDPCVIYKNVDIMMIVFIGFILIILGILGGVSFYFLFKLPPDSISSKLILIYTLVGFIMVADSGWALIPSMLSSRFPKQFRATASNLAYNGGLAIGFATPFIMLENFFNSKSEWAIFVPAILGACAMIIGATRILLSIDEKSKASRGTGRPHDV